MADARIAVIGGTGLYEMEGLTDVEAREVDTPFGPPSGRINVGTLEGERVAFLPRHGVGHVIPPSALNSRANIYALKELGVERIISVTACGSLREDYAPRHIVIPDQLFDRTRNRELSFFDAGLVVHISFADPFCPELGSFLYNAARGAGATVHRGGTFMVVEGPRFSTKGESRIFRQWGADIIGMTAVPEAQLAREAEICYAAMAHVTDYDVWHETEESVTVQAVVRNLMANVDVAQSAVREAVSQIPWARESCPCATALADAIATSEDHVSEEMVQELDLIVENYL